MRDLFLAVVTLLLGVAVVRFIYGLEANSFEYVFHTFVNAFPDIKSHFQLVIDSFENLVSVFEGFGFGRKDVAWYEALLNAVIGIFDILVSFFEIIAAFVEFGLLWFRDALNFLTVFFKLFFAPAAVPIG